MKAIIFPGASLGRSRCARLVVHPSVNHCRGRRDLVQVVCWHCDCQIRRVLQRHQPWVWFLGILLFLRLPEPQVDQDAQSAAHHRGDDNASNQPALEECVVIVAVMSRASWRVVARFGSVIGYGWGRARWRRWWRCRCRCRLHRLVEALPLRCCGWVQQSSPLAGASTVERCVRPTWAANAAVPPTSNAPCRVVIALRALGSHNAVLQRVFCITAKL
mmetsp:Transcript_10995/g.25849  ORF Transcript_10995/g.25849 Transcript_10995/m.25849 type:complete len:217 (+) Transcript_10995:694-1344(+)